MPRKKSITSPIYPFHIYNRSIDGDFYPLNQEEVWNASVDLLRVVTYAYKVDIHAFVLMSNHYHLLATFPYENIGEAIGYFQRELSRWLLTNTQLQRYRFSGRYKSSLILDSLHYMYVYKYVYNNPIRAGLCNFAELYPYSTLAFRCGEIVESPPVNPSSFLSKLALGGDIEEELALLNDHFNEEEISLVRKAIRKREFSLD